MSRGVIDWLISFFRDLHFLTWCSWCVQLAELISLAAALLFQSTEQLLIDVESVRVATNGMEEILKLLTERDIEHTNNLPLHSSYLLSPFPRITSPCRACVNISLSLGLSPYPQYVPIEMWFISERCCHIFKSHQLSSCLHKANILKPNFCSKFIIYSLLFNFSLGMIVIHLPVVI